MCCICLLGPRTTNNWKLTCVLTYEQHFVMHWHLQGFKSWCNFLAQEKKKWDSFIKILFSVVGQEYQSEIISEHVILGNDVLFKCSIPSFVADFVQVDAWIDSDAESHYQSPIYGKLGLAVRIRLRTASCKGLLNVV